jgi:uncharacterized protein (TIGR03085 family)
MTAAPLRSGAMADVAFDADERARLCDLLDELGPEAPTLLEPWTTRDLAAHLVVREHDSLAGPGLVLPGAWGRLAERRRSALAARDFTELVATIRSGPPPGFFRIGWVRRFPNLNEFFVHHEDVRRANGRGPRTNELAVDEALWRNVSQAPWFLARPPGPFGHAAENRPLTSRDLPASCCSTCSAGSARRRSTSSAPPRRSKPSAAPGSASRRSAVSPARRRSGRRRVPPRPQACGRRCCGRGGRPRRRARTAAIRAIRRA